ncbi:MAG: hypothetical protein ILA02_03655 [Clostridia bacterium]|nr:hypothetical protein [Clostridia bacterium]
MDNQEQIIVISKEERDDIVKLLVAYKGMVDKTIEQLNKKHKYIYHNTLATCIQCSKDVEILINNLKAR